MDGIIAGQQSTVEVIGAEKIAVEKQEVTVVVKVGLGCSSIKVTFSTACKSFRRMESINSSTLNSSTFSSRRICSSSKT